MIGPSCTSSSLHPSSSYRNPFQTQTLTLTLTLTLQTLLKRGFKPSIRSLNLLLSSLLSAQKPNLVLQIFSQITSNSIPINSHTHSLAALALLKTRRFKEAHQFISNTHQFPPRKSLWDLLIRGTCVAGAAPETALSILHQCVRSHGVSPSRGTYRSLVLSFSSRGEMGKAIEVLEAMTSENARYPLDDFVCSSIVSGFCKIGRPELGSGFYEEIQAHQFQPNLVTYTAVVNALCRGGRIDEACRLVYKMEKEGIALDAVLYSSWICGYFRQGVLMEGLRKHRLMVGNGIGPDVVSYTNLIDGLCREGFAEKAIGFFREMEKSGIEPNVVTYTTLIQGLCNRGKLDEAFWVLRRMEGLGVSVDELVYSVLINELSRNEDFEGVFGLINEMEGKGIEVGTMTYNIVINGLCKAGKTGRADEISRRFSGDNFTYSTLLHGYSKEIDAAGVMETKRRLEAAGICVDVVTCNVLIKALFVTDMIEDASSLFKEMPEKGIVSNSITYYAMIAGYCKVGMLDNALEVFDEYKTTSRISDAACHDCIIRGLCKKHMVEMATEAFEDLVERNLVTSSATYRILIAAQFRECNGEGVLNFIHRLEKLEPGLVSTLCNDAVAFLCTRYCSGAALDIYILLRRRSMSIANKSYYLLLKHLMYSGNKQISRLLVGDYIKRFGLFERRSVYIMSLYLCQENVDEAVRFLNDRSKTNVSVTIMTAVVNAFMKEGRVEDAHSFLKENEKNGVFPDLVVYSIMVDSLCKDGYLEKALDLCESMSKKGIHPTIVIYNSVLNGLCRQGCLVEAFRLFDSLEQKNVLPTVITYGTLLGVLCREGFLQDANRLFERMILKCTAPTTRVYNLLVKGYCSFGLIEEALKLLSDLEGNSLLPDGFTISALISGYCVNGDIEGALGFFGEYRRKGFLPDFLGFMNLIKGLFAKGRMEEARTILRDMLQCAEVMDLIKRTGDELLVDSLINLLALACDQGRIEEVIDVLNEVGFVSFSSWRPYSDNRLRRLKELQEKGALDADVGGIVSTKGGFSQTIEVPRNIYGSLTWQSMTADTNDINHSLLNMGKGDSGTENHENLMGKSLYYDFDTYYPIIASLCAKGDLHKANDIVKAMLSNS